MTASDAYLSLTAVCQECQLLVRVSELQPGFRANCPRCGGVIISHYRNAEERILVFGMTAFLCLLFSLLFDFIALSAGGQHRSISLVDAIQQLFQLGEWPLALFIAVIIVALPAAFLSCLLWLTLNVRLGRAGRSAIRVLRWIDLLRFWNMAEIFLLGILVSMIKIATLADLAIGPSLYAYGGFTLFLIVALLHFDKLHFGLRIRVLASAGEA